MAIDWFTFTAQVINFLVLVWLLKRFLYAPVIRAMDDRQARIQAKLADAEEARADAARAAVEHREKIDQLQHTREQLLAEAGQEVEQWRAAHIKQAQTEVDRTRIEWQRTLEREKQAYTQELRHRTADHVQRLTRLVLSQLANADLEQQAIGVFLERLHQIEPDQRNRIAAAIRDQRHRVSILSAFDVHADGRQRIVDEVHQHLTDGIEVDFRRQPGLICGIELQAAGYKVSWSADESLQTIDEEFTQAIEATVQASEIQPAIATESTAASATEAP